MNKARPFEDLRVIELASVLAGPAVGMFFAELGAKVIKIENPGTNGDITRQWKSSGENNDSELSAYYQSVNWGKEVFFIDISTADGFNDLLKHLQNADVLLLNFKSGDAEKFKLDFDSLSEKFPELICAYLTGYGENDNRPAFDLVMQAETGFMHMNGTPESGPLKMPVAIIDLMAAHQLKEGILTALYLREKNGKGNAVHVSLFDSAIASLANQASNFLIAGKDPQRMGSLHPNIAPYGETFLCADGKYIVLAIGTEKQFAQFCTVIGKPELISNPKFSSNQVRVQNRMELNEKIVPFFLKRISEEAAAILEKGKVPNSIIKSVGEILSSGDISQLLIDRKVVRTAIFKID
ncbi:MAG TPA: CaiB/BaiF CoA-transferase family protein [Bacteroidia bacterium]|nr:CaiB/BaiF CoA-transferase family protein [Bacteroidia bacterium]